MPRDQYLEDAPRMHPLISSLVMAASLGFLSTLHCWGMCGSLVAVLQLGIPPALRAQRKSRLVLTPCYPFGRITA